MILAFKESTRENVDKFVEVSEFMNNESPVHNRNGKRKSIAFGNEFNSNDDEDSCTNSLCTDTIMSISPQQQNTKKRTLNDDVIFDNENSNKWYC